MTGKRLTSLMLSKLLQYARNILTLQTPASPLDLHAETKSLTTAMVTTRRQSGSNSDPATDVSPTLESLPQNTHTVSSKKRRRPQTAVESTSRATKDDSAPASTRKRQKLPVREKDEQHFKKHIHIAIEIPVRDITQDDAPMWTAPEQGKTKSKRALAEDTSSNPEVHEKDNEDGDESEKGQASSPVAQVAVEEATSSHDISEKTVAARQQRKKVGFKPKKKNSSPLPVIAAFGSDTTKPKHKRFNSEEPEAEEFDLVVKEGARVEETDEGTDDDAPEVVATHNAQEKATVTARSAAKAVEE
jgi:hypothetical protein